jgi:hypothetical protein
MSFWSDVGDIFKDTAEKYRDEWIAEEFPEKTVPVDNTTGTTVTPDHADDLERDLEARNQRNMILIGGSVAVVLVLTTILVTR